MLRRARHHKQLRFVRWAFLFSALSIDGWESMTIHCINLILDCHATHQVVETLLLIIYNVFTKKVSLQIVGISECSIRLFQASWQIIVFHKLR